jgi:predicted AlkP superfamily pyrophosphatase or phosphodiesterase
MKLICQSLIVVIFFLLVPASGQQKIDDLRPTIILISLDGFRWDYLDKYRPKAIGELARNGVRAKWMIPSFPTKTFPNHYTIATGLYPQNHGIVENNVYDFGEVFTMSKRSEVENPRWWWGEPVWVTAEKQGQIAASYFFVGTETTIQGEAPTFWRTYNGRVPNIMRVDKILGYLDLPKEKRPTMLSMYFSTTDDVGHEFGPEAEETKYAVEEVDGYIERLVAGLKKRGIDREVNIIITSDHGMAPVDQRNAIVMDDYFNTANKALTEQIVMSGEIWQIFPKPNKENEIVESLKAIKNARCWRKAEIPARLNYSKGKRIAPIVCSPDMGWFLTTRERYETQKKSDDFDKTRGAHGYDNKYQEMQATFIAHGSAFKKGFVAEPFENVEVYNVMCKILGLTPAKNDGDLERVKGMLSSSK